MTHVLVSLSTLVRSRAVIARLVEALGPKTVREIDDLPPVVTALDASIAAGLDALTETGSEETSREIASIAARGLANPSSLSASEVARVCASALTQAEDRP